MEIVEADQEPYKGFKKEYYKETDHNLNKVGQHVVTVFEKTSMVQADLPKFIARKVVTIIKHDGDDKREYQILKRCNHENVLKLFYWEVAKVSAVRINYILIYTELCDQNLKTFLEENNLSLEHVKMLAMQLVSGCQYLHGKHVVHRDIKPENILVHKKDCVSDTVLKIGDFGLSRFMPPIMSSSVAQLTACGTRDYCSPEMIHAMDKSEHIFGNPYPSDIFSLGVVLTEMLMGQRPFTQIDLRRNATEVNVANVINNLATLIQNPVLACELMEDGRNVESGVCHGLIKMLQFEPRDRPRADELPQYFSKTKKWIQDINHDKTNCALVLWNLPDQQSHYSNLQKVIYDEYKKRYPSVRYVWVCPSGQYNQYAVIYFDDMQEAQKATGSCQLEEGELEDNKLVEKYYWYARPPSNFNPCLPTQLCINDLTPRVVDAELRRQFSACRKILDLDASNNNSMKPKFAAIQFMDVSSVVKAVSSFHGDIKLELPFFHIKPVSLAWCRGIAETVTEACLRTEFGRFGDIREVILDGEKEQAIIHFVKDVAAQKAVREMRGRSLEGSRLKVEYAAHKWTSYFFQQCEEETVLSIRVKKDNY